jgi:hypothetical protein
VGLRGKGCAIVDCRQRVFDVMAEAFEESSDPFQFGDDLRRRAIVAPLVRERDPERVLDRA